MNESLAEKALSVGTIRSEHNSEAATISMVPFLKHLIHDLLTISQLPR